MASRTFVCPAATALAIGSCVAFALALGTANATAQDPFTWQNSTELSFVSTGGNSSASTLGLKTTLTGTGDPNTFKFEVGGIRSETTTTMRTATGTSGSFTIDRTTVSQVTAENYFARGRYDRELAGAFAFAGGGWSRNTFAGIQNRFALVAGFGRTLIDSDLGHFKADLGGTYTVQKDVDPTPGADDGFAGFRVTLDVARQVSESADFTSVLEVDENLEESDDVRADWINSLTLSLSERLAFKTSVQVLYDHVPAQISVPLLDGSGTPTGTNVLTPGEKVDSVVTLTLVIRL